MTTYVLFMAVDPDTDERFLHVPPGLSELQALIYADELWAELWRRYIERPFD